MNTTPDASVPLLPFGSASDAEIQDLLKHYQIGLTVDEAKSVSRMLGRDPTVSEAVIWGIQGSEHCSYKSSRRFLSQFLTKGKHIILGPKEDSGIVAITDGPDGKRWGLAISHESHNHPSQIVPFEGAATGIGGVVRDVVCMGARVVGAMDMLRLGDLKTNESRTIAKEVARGIAGYGNPLGIPNLGGDTVFDSAYNTNCLVNAIAMGIVREDEVIHSTTPEEAARENYDIILVGKPTDRSGFGGAAFASISLEEEKKEQNTGAVQEPNPFLERHLLASTYALFDWLAASGNLEKVSFKDLGAGGVVCASVEQVSERNYGAVVDLNKVHVALDDLPAEVIGCAETQERFCWTCHPSLTEHIIKHYNETWDLPSVAKNARASVIGKVTDNGIYTLMHDGKVVCSAKSVDITSGLQYTRPTEEKPKEFSEPSIECANDTVTVDGKSFTLSEIFTAVLSHPNGASTSPILKHYDKNVIGNSMVEAGEADAGVIAPLQNLRSYVQEGEHPGWELSEEDAWRGVAVAADGKGRYGRISPYWQGVNAAVESMRNVAAVGAMPRALTDCLNYGNPEKPEHLWALQEGVRGIAEASKEVTLDGECVPIISGNVSLYNSLPNGDSIDPTAVVCCVGVVPDARKACTMQLKSDTSTLLFIGSRKDECGGSLYYQVLESLTGSKKDALLGAHVPKPSFEETSKEILLVTKFIQEDKVLSCHDVSDGGMAMALFEMTLPQRKVGGTIGIEADVSTWNTLRPDVALFSETGGFILEVSQESAEDLQKEAENMGVPCSVLGKTTNEASLVVTSGESILLKMSLSDLRSSWEQGLASIF